MGMFDETEDIAVSDAVSTQIELYKHMTLSMRKLQVAKTKDEEFRFQKLTMKVDNGWLNLSREDQIQCVKELVKADLMTQQMADMLLMFDGKIDNSKPQEPCYRIK